MAEKIAAELFLKLGSYAIQQIGLAWGVEKELAKMENNVSIIRDILLDAHEREMSNHAVKAWLERLEDVLYDADDLLDEVATETKRRQMETQDGLVRKMLSSLPAGWRHLVSLERLAIRFCPLFNWSDGDYDLKGLKSLKKLGFYSLPKLVTLPKGLEDAAATLTHLEIEHCARFTLPSECILPNLQSLQSLKIYNCPEVKSLPEGMQGLTGLQFLSISYCSLDTSKYREGGEDWHKIDRIPTTEIFSNIKAFQT